MGHRNGVVRQELIDNFNSKRVTLITGRKKGSNHVPV